jgi:hypothetical protein
MAAWVLCVWLWDLRATTGVVRRYLSETKLSSPGYLFPAQKRAFSQRPPQLRRVVRDFFWNIVANSRDFLYRAILRTA